MKRCLLTTGLLGLTFAAQAISYSDADFFGTATDPSKPKEVHPSGVHLVYGTASASKSSSFDFTNPTHTSDTTLSFKIGKPYLTSDQGTYKSVLGFDHLHQAVDEGSLEVTLFFRDPSAGSETVTFTADDFMGGTSDILIKRTIKLSGGESGFVDADINADGVLNYKVTSTKGEFWLDAAFATIDTHQVPDGGSTALILGLALMGMEGVRRKFNRA